MITERQKRILTYYLTRSIFLGIGFSLMFDKTYQDTWISTIIGIILGSIIIFLIKKIMDQKQNLSLSEYLSNIKGGLIFKILIFLFSIFFILASSTILISFITSFFLLNTPSFYVLIPIFSLLIYISFKGLSNICKTAESLFLITSIIPIIIIATLIKYSDFSYLLPIFNTSIKNITYSSFLYALLSSTSFIFLLNLKNDGSKLIKTYIMDSISLLFTILIIFLVLGRNLTTIYRFPEYMVLKRIKIYTFIENIENIVSLIWIIDQFISMAMASITIFNLIKPKNRKFLFPLIMIIIFIVMSFYIGTNYQIMLKIYYKTFIIYIISFILIILPLSIISKTKKDG